MVEGGKPALLLLLAFLLLPARQGGTMTIEEIRQKLESAKAHYQGPDRAGFEKAVDQSLASLEAQHGENVSVADAVKVLREFAASEAAESPGPAAGGTKLPEGVRIEHTPGGFRLRVPCRSFGGLAAMIIAVVMGAIPFVVMGDFVRDTWNAEGLSRWLGTAFLAVWLGAGLYAFGTGVVAMCGEIRISKFGDSGEIFTGIGGVGLKHSVRWSDYSGAGDSPVAVQTSRGLFTHAVHSIGLKGTSKSYRFGSDLSDEQQAFVIAFLKEQVFQAALN